MTCLNRAEKLLQAQETALGYRYLFFSSHISLLYPGVSIKIEVINSPRFQGVSGGMLPQKILKLQSSNERFPAFSRLN